MRRWTAGFTYRQDRFVLAPEPPGSGGLPELLRGDPPADRALAYPWIGVSSLQDEYLTSRNQDRLDRIEDVALGRHSYARLGFSSRAFGGSGEQAVFAAGIGGGLRPSPAQTILLDADLAGRWGGSGGENLRLDLGARYYRRNLGDHLFFATLKGSLASRLDPERQLLLGGDSGLRGYPLRYQAGNRGALLTLEERFFTDFNPWKLFRVGAAVFFDAGAVWQPDPTSGASNLGLLKDIGAGLRLGSTRSGRGSVVHLDVAFPLDGDGSIRSLQWLVSSKESF